AGISDRRTQTRVGCVTRWRKAHASLSWHGYPQWLEDRIARMVPGSAQSDDRPADDAELVVKMLNSGAPGVMLDLEDSTVNEWEHQRLGVENILEALRGTLTYFDKKRDKLVGIK